MDIKEVGRIALRGTLATAVVTLGVVLTVYVVSDLYDLRVVLAVLAGKFGYDFVYAQLGKINGL